MTKARHTSTSILRSAISLQLQRVLRVVLLIIAYHLSLTTSPAQGFLNWQVDRVPLFRGVAIGFDMAGAAQSLLSDYRQYEVMARVNLHDQYFPTVEVGYGEAQH